MSKKLSQAEIDALVASLLAGEAPTEESAEKPAQPDAEPPAGSPVAAAPEPAAEAAGQPAAAPAPAAGKSPALTPFEQIVDLGPITQAEVEAAEAAYRNGTAPVIPSTAQASPSPAPQPAAAAAVMAAPPTAPAMPTPPSHAAYAAHEAQAAQQTRMALSMAQLRGVLMDIELTVTVELGRAKLSLGEVLSLGPGSVITLDKLANTPVDVMVNRLPLMKAEVLAIGEKYGIRITKSDLNVKAAS
ncbi:MAG: FliM/FliN family flagellar motor switch protein [Bacillota bacterium]